MGLGDAIAQLLAFTTTLDPRTAAVLFFICAIGEFGISIPYVLETIWLLVGYHLVPHIGSEVLSPPHLVGLWLAAQCGRQVGALALYHTGRFGSTSLLRFYNNSRVSRFFSRVAKSRVLKRIDLSSPFSVAFGRLFWMRIPLSLTLGVMKKLKTLSMGVLISSLIWDAVYISVGLIVGATAQIKPLQMFIYSLAGLTLIYLITFLVRRLIRRPQPAVGG